jgi:hypothetical protein
MHDPEQRSTTSSPRPGEDAVRVAPRDARAARAGMVYTIAAGVLVLGGAAFLAMQLLDGDDLAAQTPTTARTDAGSTAQRATALPRAERLEPISAAAVQAPDAATALAGGDLADYVDPNQPPPTMQDVIRKLNDAGIHSGLGAFNPPGTSPPLIGLAVPEDFPLPPGYVRHYQTTDDGQDIEAILMFSPDFEFFDANGRRIDVPENRVVPPEMAPPGLKPRTITVPPPLPERGKP